MALAIGALLNPVRKERGNRFRQLPSPSPTDIMSSYPSTPSPVIGKPGRPFDKASAKKMTRGEVRFPPYITDNREIMKKQRELQMGPPEEIQFYAKHIPYSSEKKTFLSRTGRESFEGRQRPSQIIFPRSLTDSQQSSITASCPSATTKSTR